MSGALTESERTDLRRFCGYPVWSGGQARPDIRDTDEIEFRMSNLSDTELAVARSFLTTLNALEQDVPASAATLDTSAASVWTRNPEELDERMSLLAAWSRRLCRFLGVRPGADLRTASSARLAI